VRPGQPFAKLGSQRIAALVVLDVVNLRWFFYVAPLTPSHVTSILSGWLFPPTTTTQKNTLFF
jgi:hypothetical protein